MSDHEPPPGVGTARPGREAVHRTLAGAVADGHLRPDDRWAQARLVLALLGPGGRGPAPPPAIEDLVRAALVTTDENPADLAVAVGAGWGRDATGHGWDGRWPSAVGEVVRMVRSSLVAINRALTSSVPRAALDVDDLVELPSLFAMALLGACDCDHHVRGCGRRCGRDCCYPDHDLRRWDPAVCHLRAFVDQAVTGSARGVLQGGAFAESLLYRALAREGRAVRRKVEFCRCSGCGTLYEGSACPNEHCRRRRDDATVRVKRVNWLVTPAVEGGDHDEVVRCVCAACGNLFHRGDPVRCPACLWRPGSGESVASVTVWTRVPQGATPRCGRRRAPALDSH